MNMSKEEKIVIASALICQVLVIFAIIILGNMYFPCRVTIDVTP